MAEALAQARGWDAESAGISVPASNHAAPNAVRAVRDARGLDLEDHTPRDASDANLAAADRVVALDPSVATGLRTQHGVREERLVVWSIADPYGGRLADYRLCLERIDAALDDLLQPAR
jgi:protein-tyrosine-phosphatase